MSIENMHISHIFRDERQTGVANGPPKENKSERVHLLMSPSELKAIDDWGFAHRVRTRGGAIRQLVALGLAYGAMDKALGAADAVIYELINEGRTSRKLLERYLEARFGSIEAGIDAIGSQVDVLKQGREL